MDIKKTNYQGVFNTRRRLQEACLKVWYRQNYDLQMGADSPAFVAVVANEFQILHICL